MHPKAFDLGWSLGRALNSSLLTVTQLKFEATLKAMQRHGRPILLLLLLQILFLPSSNSFMMTSPTSSLFRSSVAFRGTERTVFASPTTLRSVLLHPPPFVPPGSCRLTLSVLGTTSEHHRRCENLHR
eukprot:2075709-Rhodomonas_salina.3